MFCDFIEWEYLIIIINYYYYAMSMYYLKNKIFQFITKLN